MPDLPARLRAAHAGMTRSGNMVGDILASRPPRSRNCRPPLQSAGRRRAAIRAAGTLLGLTARRRCSVDYFVALRGIRQACMGRGMGMQCLPQRILAPVIRANSRGSGSHSGAMAAPTGPWHGDVRGRGEGAEEARPWALPPARWVPARRSHRRRLGGASTDAGRDAAARLVLWDADGVIESMSHWASACWDDEDWGKP